MAELRRTQQVRAVEERFGNRPIREIITETYRRVRTLPKTAEALGVKYGTLQYWVIRLGITTRTWRFPDEPPEGGEHSEHLGQP